MKIDNPSLQQFADSITEDYNLVAKKEVSSILQRLTSNSNSIALQNVFRLPAMYGYNSIDFIQNIPERLLSNPDLILAQYAIYFTRAILFLQPYRDFVWETIAWIESKTDPYQIAEIIEYVESSKSLKNFYCHSGTSDFDQRNAKLQSNLQRFTVNLYPSENTVNVVLAAVLFTYVDLTLIQDEANPQALDPENILQRVMYSAVRIQSGIPVVSAPFSITRKNVVQIDYKLINEIYELMEKHDICLFCQDLPSTEYELTQSPGFVCEVNQMLASYCLAE